MDKYTDARRSCQWVYDHTVFPFIMMLNMVCFFSNILYFTSKGSDFQSQESKNMEIASYPTQMLMLLGTLTIYCFEMFVSFSEFKQFGLTQKEK